MIDVDNITSLINIQPSLEWLTACRRYLEQRHIPLTDDAIFQQLLHADLRHVIGNSDESEEEGELRRGITSSLPTSDNNNASCKKVLTNFRGVVQIEEVVDVSLDNESRIGGATTTPQTQQQQQQQRQPQQRHQRCLKFVLTDGSNTHPILAMETHPLPTLPPSPPAGLKLLLHGTITIRYGVLLLNEGNTTVLGGFIPSKVEFQRKEMERVRGQSGVGVDPTVRALIWNPLSGMEGEGEDEGEGESTDVVRTAVGQMAVVPGRQQLPLGQQTGRQQQQQQQSVDNNQSGGGYVTNNNNRPNTVTTNANNNGSNIVRNDNVNNRFTTNPVVVNQHNNNNRNNNGSCTTRHDHDNINSSAAMDWSPTTNNEPTSIRRRQQQQSQPISRIHNPYNTNATTTTTTNSSSFHRPAPIATTTPGLHQTTPVCDLTTPPSSPPPSTLLSPTAITSPLSFPEFYHLWTNSLSRDRHAYEGHYNRRTTFVVPAKMKGRIVDFNIEKGGKGGGMMGSSSKKYIYYLTCHITGTTDNPVSNTICCQVSDEILEPYFGKSAVEMRKFSRENKPISDKLVHDGGERVLNSLKHLSQFRMVLSWSPGDFFDNGVVEKKGGVTKCPVFLVAEQGDLS